MASAGVQVEDSLDESPLWKQQDIIDKRAHQMQLEKM